VQVQYSIDDVNSVDAISAMLIAISLVLPAMESEAHGSAEIKTCCIARAKKIQHLYRESNFQS
jgi:hypothetical protein